jgi:hypothetical protein
MPYTLLGVFRSPMRPPFLAALFLLACASAPAPAQTQKPAPAPDGKTVAQTLALMGIASTCYAGMLNGLPKQPYTVFGPTNDAFARLEERGQALDQHQQELLLCFHVVPGRYPAEALKAGPSPRTLNAVFVMQGARAGPARIRERHQHQARGAGECLHRVQQRHHLPHRRRAGAVCAGQGAGGEVVRRGVTPNRCYG